MSKLVHHDDKLRTGRNSWIEADGRVIADLEFTGCSDPVGHKDYRVHLCSVSEEQWNAAFAIERDVRDVPWFVCDLSGKLPFCRFDAAWVPRERRLSLKYLHSFVTQKPVRMRRLRQWLGLQMPTVTVPQESAPLSWEKLDQREAVNMLNSRNRLDLWRGLIKISARASRDQANWAVDLFVANSSHPDDTVRIAALSGLGEMARVHGVTTQRAVDVARKAAAEDPSPVVRRYASKSVAEIARFCPSVGVE